MKKEGVVVIVGYDRGNKPVHLELQNETGSKAVVLRRSVNLNLVESGEIVEIGAGSLWVTGESTISNLN